MSIQAVASVLESDVGEVAAKMLLVPNELTYSLNLEGKVSGRARLLMATLEAVAMGAVHADSMLDVKGLLRCNLRRLRLAFNELRDAGHIVVATSGDDALTISFGGYRLTVAALPSAVIDDPWQVIRAKVFATKGSQCHYCGEDASQIDHVLPRSRGGLDVMDNLVPACAACNHAKGDLTPEEWPQ